MRRIKTVSQAEGARMRRQGAVLLDVRSEQEYRAGHLPGSVLLPVTKVAMAAGSVVPDKSRVVLLYCSRGERSRAAAQVLLALGYCNVYVLRP